MERRQYLRKIAASSVGGVAIIGEATANRQENRDTEEILDGLEKALEKDEEENVPTLANQTSSQSRFEQELAKLSREERAAVSKEALNIEGGSQGPSDNQYQLMDSSWEVYTFVYGEYEIGGHSRKVFEWRQEIDWKTDGDEITEIDERYWATITGVGRANNWQKTEDNVRSESGGEGDDTYRLYTSAEFAMCAGVGPVGGCMNRSTVWIDQRVYADGTFDYDYGH